MGEKWNFSYEVSGQSFSQSDFTVFRFTDHVCNKMQNQKLPPGKNELKNTEGSRNIYLGFFGCERTPHTPPQKTPKQLPILWSLYLTAKNLWAQTSKQTSALTAFRPAGLPLISDSSISMQFELQGRRWEWSQSTIYFVANVTKGETCFSPSQRKRRISLCLFSIVVLMRWDGNPPWGWKAVLLLVYTHTCVYNQQGIFVVGDISWKY